MRTTTADEHARWCVVCRGAEFGYREETLTCRRCRRDFVFTADDPWMLLAVATATAELVAHTGRGTASRGIGAARRARALDPAAVGALFWKGACHHAAGRTAPALVGYQRFVSEAATVKRLRTLAGLAAHRSHLLRATTS
jgi:hypothetical protein